METKKVQLVNDIAGKVKGKKLLILILIIITLIIVCSIVIFLLKSRKSKEEKESVDETNLLVNESETYEGLNYSQTKENISKEGFFYNYGNNTEGSKIDVSYLKIEGLKNKLLEENVNSFLKARVESMYNKENISDPSILYDHIYNYTDVYIFNNVLSTMYVEEICNTDGEITKKYFSLNLNLKDMSNFELNDVFIANTDINSIIPQYSKDIVFSISPKFLYYVDNNEVKKIKLYDYRNQVAIYKRFFDNNRLFEKTFNASPYVFTIKYFNESDVYGIQDGNIFIDTSDTLVGKSYNEGILESAYKLYKDAVNKSKNLAYSNPSNRYLAQLVLSIEKVDADNAYEINVKITSYKITKTFFNEKLSEFIVASENKSNDEVQIVDYLNNAPMEADNYITKVGVDNLRIEVDENGNEISENSGNSIGLS